MSADAEEWDETWNDEGDDGREPVDGGYPPDDLEDILSGDMVAHPNNVVKRARGRNTGTTQLLAKERTRRALELRKAGATYEAIAQQLGYAGSNGAWQAVQRGIAAGMIEPAQDLRFLQYERLNNMLLVRWPMVQAGDSAAINDCLRIMDKMDRLMGTDAPQRSEVDVSIEGAIIVAEVDGDSYLKAMKAMVLNAADGQEIGDIDHDPTGMRGLPSHTSSGDARRQYDEADIMEGVVINESDTARPAPKPKKAAAKKAAAKGSGAAKKPARESVTISTAKKK